jgi:glutamate---cysteine ligase / carboxylate-amine ligase
MSAVIACPVGVAPLRAFSAVGLELEYMIVRTPTLDVAPIADRLLDERTGASGLAWSNELVAHVVELKNPRPTSALAMLPARLQAEICAMNAVLAASQARLMPTAMHPWMDPSKETRLWPRDNEIYRAYDRIFNCSSHGWSNLQSMHINLPFGDDHEFGRLHAAVRLVLPILPAIAASSPFAEGRHTGWLDYRLRAYEGNAGCVPQMNGEMVPDPITSRGQYEREILAPLYAALAPHDQAGLLREEWVNARGAIARFDRSAIEIRLIDTQECAEADVAVAAAVVDLVRLLYDAGPAAVPTSELARILRLCMRDAERAKIDSPAYLDALIGRSDVCDAREVWERLAGRMSKEAHRPLWQPLLSRVLREGPLARRLLNALGANPSREQLANAYTGLCECLEHGVPFAPSSC